MISQGVWSLLEKLAFWNPLSLSWDILKKQMKERGMAVKIFPALDCYPTV